jgi:hypothetical protein
MGRATEWRLGSARSGAAAARRRAADHRARRGFGLPLALLLCVALGSIATATAIRSVTESRIAVNFDAFHRALDVAEGGLERGLEMLAAAYESGAALPDTITLVPYDTLSGFTYSVRAQVRKEPGALDLNRNGLTGEVVRYSRAWGFSAATASGGAGDEGEPVRQLTAGARGATAGEELSLEVALERDPSVADPRARGAWRAVRLRWSSLAEPWRR